MPHGSSQCSSRARGLKNRDLVLEVLLVLLAQRKLRSLQEVLRLSAMGVVPKHSLASLYRKQMKQITRIYTYIRYFVLIKHIHIKSIYPSHWDVYVYFYTALEPQRVCVPLKRFVQIMRCWAQSMIEP